MIFDGVGVAAEKRTDAAQKMTRGVAQRAYGDLRHLDFAVRSPPEDSAESFLQPTRPMVRGTSTCYRASAAYLEL